METNKRKNPVSQEVFEAIAQATKPVGIVETPKSAKASENEKRIEELQKQINKAWYEKGLLHGLGTCLREMVSDGVISNETALVRLEKTTKLLGI